MASCGIDPNIFVLPVTHHVISIFDMSGRVAPIRGEITEIVGAPSSGRTSHLIACLGDVVSRGDTAALVDTEETFDPGSAAQAGIVVGAIALGLIVGARAMLAIRGHDGDGRDDRPRPP